MGTDRAIYFDMIVARVVAGDNTSQWSKLIDFLMTADSMDYNKVSRQYPELMDAIKRYNDKHKDVVESRLQRKVK